MRKFGKIVGAVCTVLTMTSFSASAANCAALDYAELQDMSVPELVKEMCFSYVKADDEAVRGLNKFLALEYGEKGDEAASQIRQAGIDQCRNQAERMRKMLVRKGVEESSSTYQVLCAKK